MTAETLAKGLGGRKVGGGWMARCPAHEDREPSLSIRKSDDGKVLIRCHAGCDQSRVIAALRSQGLWEGSSRQLARPQPRAGTTREPSCDDDAKRGEVAASIWRSTIRSDRTLIETYLASRGLHVRPPATVRFHPRLRHQSGGAWPVMVALVTRGTDDAPLGIHRTYLARDGSSKAHVSPQKMMLGPCRGGAVRLANACDVLMVGEGIETCLAAMQATGIPAWAALSTAGLRALDLPSEVREVIILADGDDPGEAAARAAAQRWMLQGRSVRIARPPRGLDFNDLLMGRAARPDGAA